MIPQKARLEPLLRLQSQSKIVRRSPPRLTHQQQPQVRNASSLQSSSYRSSRPLDGASSRIPALSSTRRAAFDSRVCNPPFRPLQAASFSSSSTRSQDQASQQELTSQQYHRLSDEVFESLYGQLEEIVENGSQTTWEVEYSVGLSRPDRSAQNDSLTFPLDLPWLTARSPHPLPPSNWNLCNQQTAPEQANLAFVPSQWTKTIRLRSSIDARRTREGYLDMSKGRSGMESEGVAG